MGAQGRPGGQSAISGWDGGSFTAPALAPDGTAAAPSYSFAADPNTGMYRPGADRIGFATGGVARWEIDIANSGALKPASDNAVPLGTSTLRPSFVHAGTSFRGPIGSLATPSFSFKDEPGTGFYLNAAVAFIEFTKNGNIAARISDSAARFLDGGATAPGISFVNDPDTGFVRPGVNRLQPATAGVARWEWDASGHYLGVADNTYNIGASGASRPAIVEAATRFKGPAGSASAAAFAYNADVANGIFFPAIGQVGVAAGGVEVARFDASAVAGNTRLQVWDVDNAALERVTVGAADSGGVGFKVLRIPN